ncbi:MAG: hypothetical protein RugAbin2_01872 [Rugosibacter sp.]|jgi:hypothetical protein|nr:hypothetical protein [Rugosibacter sp.]
MRGRTVSTLRRQIDNRFGLRDINATVGATHHGLWQGLWRLAGLLPLLFAQPKNQIANKQNKKNNFDHNQFTLYRAYGLDDNSSQPPVRPQKKTTRPIANNRQ